jgi:DNA-binding SARP family transcriptional activator
MKARAYLTGRVCLEVGGTLAVDEQRFRGRQERIVFAYLVSERTRPAPREELAQVVWPAGGPPAWPAALSAIVSRLRSQLSQAREPVIRNALSSGFGQYRLHLPADTWVDVEAAALALDEAEGALRRGETRRAFGPAVVASTIARHPFLAGDDGEWVVFQRERLQRVRLRALECLAKVWLESGEPALAVEATSEALAIEPFRETSHQLLMRAHALAGNPAEAVRAYQHLRERLITELGTDPSKETEAVYLQVLG